MAQLWRGSRVHALSPLDQINATNFNKLEVAWRFKPDFFGPRPEYYYQGTPLVVKGRMFVTAGSRRDVVCLDPGTGELLWMHSENEGVNAAKIPRGHFPVTASRTGPTARKSGSFMSRRVTG